jgi:hypothetical protein
MVIHMDTSPMFQQLIHLIFQQQAILLSTLSIFTQLRLIINRSIPPLKKYLKLGWKSGYRLKMKEV